MTTLVFTILLFYTNLFASEIPVPEIIELDITKAVELAIQHNEDIKIGKVNIEKFEYQYKEALSYALPKVTAQLNWANYLKSPILSADMGPPIGSIAVPMKQPYDLDFSATLTQPIWTFGKVSTALDIADDARDAQEASLHATKEQIKYQTKFLYNTVLFTEKVLAISKGSYENALKNKKKLRNKFRYGRISRYDNVKMSADVALRIPAMMDAENSVNIARSNFKLITGNTSENKTTLTSTLVTEFPSFKASELTNIMLENEPTLIILKKNIGINENIAKLKKANYYPSIGLFATYQYAGNSRHTFVGSNNMYNMFVLGIGIKGTLWDSFETHSRYQQALRDKDIAELTYTKARKGFTTHLKTTISEYNTLVEKYKANVAALSLANKSYNISVSSFTSGKVTQTQLNDAELMLAQAKMGTELTLYKINNCIAKIEQLTTQINKENEEL